jgi:hypothetical protein
MLRKTLVACAVIAAVALTSAATQKDEAPKGAPEGEFAGKVLSVAVKDPGKGAMLQNARVRRLGGRDFLVGTYVRPPEDRGVPKMTCWFPIDEVLAIVEFESLEDARKASGAREGSK